MSQNASTADALHEPNPQETNTGYISEQVYAETKRAFTQVSCHEVYAFSSIATSNDLSRTVTTIDDAIQLGVEISFPNNRRELLVFQPKNLLQADPDHRDHLLENLFNEGQVWIGDYESVFTLAGFPKMWDTLVVPDTESVNEVFNYTDDNLTEYSPSGKRDLAAVLGSVGAFSGAFVLGAGLATAVAPASFGAFLGIAALPIALVSIISRLYGETIINWVNSRIELETPHIWMQRIDASDNELADSTPLPESEQQRILDSLTALDGLWTTSTVVKVTEDKDTTMLYLMTSQGQMIEVPYQTPADTSDRFTLNQLVTETSVNTIQDLQGEQVQVSLTTLAQGTHTASDDFHRVRAAD